MAEKTQDELAEEGQEAEYAKPNPAANPRNISLGEIANRVAEQHKVEFQETAPSVDEDGNVTEPPPSDAPTESAGEPDADAAPQSSESAPEQPPKAAPAEPDPTKESIDPAKMYKVKVDGQELEVPGQKIIDAGYRTFQKETAADFRLNVATNLMQEAERRMAEASGGKKEDAPAAQKSEGPSAADLAKAIQFGTPEEAEKAINTLAARGEGSPQQIANLVAQQSRQAARDELKFQDALKFVKTEYKDLLSNEYSKRLFFSEEHRYRAPKEQGGLGDSRPYEVVYKEIGDKIRDAFKMPKPAAEVPSTSTAKGRQEAKAKAPAVPRTAASRLSELPAGEKPKTPTEIIAGMAAKRGQNRLTPVRKE